MAKRDRAAELEALYSELPSLKCMGLCGECCAYIGMTTMERDRIAKVGPTISFDQNPCPALDFIGRCMVYDKRPMICRLWGVVEDMKCQYGCEPERYLTREEGFSFLARVREIAGEDTI